MNTLHFSTFINAPKQKVWETMLNDETYRDWTSIFNPSGSYYEGSWETGSTMRFLGPGENGEVQGMIAEIAEARPYDFMSIKHLGTIEGEEEKMFETDYGVFENYTFEEKDGGTEVRVDLDSLDEWADMFRDMWPKALERLKEIAEQ